MDDRADPKQPEIEFRIGGKLFDNKSVSFTWVKAVYIVFQIYLLDLKFFRNTVELPLVSKLLTNHNEA